MPYQTILSISAKRRGSYNITEQIADAVAKSGMQTGIAHIFVQHTSCSLTITENADPNVRRDLETVLARLAPDGDPAYRHDTEGPDDMAAHARSMLTDVSLSVPVGNGRLLLGTWQGIYLFESDGSEVHGTTLADQRLPDLAGFVLPFPGTPAEKGVRATAAPGLGLFWPNFFASLSGPGVSRLRSIAAIPGIGDWRGTRWYSPLPIKSDLPMLLNPSRMISQFSGS